VKKDSRERTATGTRDIFGLSAARRHYAALIATGLCALLLAVPLAWSTRALPVEVPFLDGTHGAGPEATEWTQLEPGVAHPLSDGDRLLLGWTVITFEQQPD
jgi:hypothetical protein